MPNATPLALRLALVKLKPRPPRPTGPAKPCPACGGKGMAGKTEIIGGKAAIVANSCPRCDGSGRIKPC